MLAALDLVERRLRDVEVAALDELRHLAVEERQQQRADVRAVDVGVGHDDDAVVAQLADVEVVAPMPVPSAVMSVPISCEPSILSRRARSTFRILPRSGRIAWKLRSRPCLAEPPAESPSTMKSSDLRRVALLAVGELARQAGDVERALAAGHLARLARGLARGRGLDDLADDHPGLRRVLLEPARQAVADHARDDRLHLGADQLVLGLRAELGVRHLDREHAGQPLAHVVAGELDLVAFRMPLLSM